MSGADVVDLDAYRWAREGRLRLERPHRRPWVATAHPGAVEVIVASAEGEDPIELWLTPADALKLGRELCELGTVADAEGRP